MDAILLQRLIECRYCSRGLGANSSQRLRCLGRLGCVRTLQQGNESRQRPLSLGAKFSQYSHGLHSLGGIFARKSIEQYFQTLAVTALAFLAASLQPPKYQSQSESLGALSTLQFSPESLYCECAVGPKL